MNRPSELDELLQGCLNGTLDEAQEQELARLLQESSEARQALRSHLQIEGGLLILAKAGHLGQSSSVPSGESAGAAADLAQSSHTCASRPARTGPQRIPSRRLALGLAVLAAVVLLLIGGIIWFTPSPVSLPAAPVLAHVVEVEGSVEIVASGGESRPAMVREPLRAGESLRTGEGNSVAVIEFADTLRLEVSPETVIRLPEDGARSVQLIQGVVRGNEAAQAQRPPLVVTTTSLKVCVEGDRFVLSSASPDSLRVDMQGGKAEVVRQRDQKSLTVESGEALLVQTAVEDMTVGSMPRFVTEPKRILDFPGAWAVFFEPDGMHLLAASSREIQRFGPDPKPEKTLISTDKNHGRIAAFSQDGNTLAVSRGLGKEDPVIFWNVAAKRQISRIAARITDRRFALAPDASWLATVDKEDSLFVCHLWDGKTGVKRFSLPTESKIECLAAAPDSSRLAVSQVDLGRRERNKILLLDTRTGKQVGVLPTRAYPLTVLAFSPDGRYLAAGITGLVQLWDVEKRELVRTIRGFERVLLTLAFSPDGKLLAGGTQDGQVWVWDASSGEEVQVIKAGTSGVRVLAFSPDGRALVTGGIKHHPLMIWEVPPPQVQPLERQPPGKI